jgi:hypothetical protein
MSGAEDASPKSSGGVNVCEACEKEEKIYIKWLITIETFSFKPCRFISASPSG